MTTLITILACFAVTGSVVWLLDRNQRRTRRRDRAIVRRLVRYLDGCGPARPW